MRMMVMVYQNFFILENVFVNISPFDALEAVDGSSPCSWRSKTRFSVCFEKHSKIMAMKAWWVHDILEIALCMRWQCEWFFLNCLLSSSFYYGLDLQTDRLTDLFRNHRAAAMKNPGRPRGRMPISALAVAQWPHFLARRLGSEIVGDRAARCFAWLVISW